MEENYISKWISSIIKREHYSFLLNLKKEKEFLENYYSYLLNDPYYPVNHIYYKIILDDIAHMIEADPHKEVLSLYFLKQYTAKDISNIVPHSQNTIEVWIWQFRKKLFQTFKGKVFE